MDQTIKKSSPDEFRPLVTAPADRFRVSPGIWDAMTSNPLVREELCRELDRRVEAAIEDRLAAKTQAAFEEARDRGYRDGFEAGKRAGLQDGTSLIHERCKLVEAKLSSVCNDILENRAVLLSAHERAWGAALRHLLRRFLVPRANSIGELVTAWLSEALARFAPGAKVLIRVSPDDYEQWVMHLPRKTANSWEIQSDASLPIGEVSCECEDGGVVFSSSEELGKLEAWLSQFESQTEPVDAVVLSGAVEGIA